MVGVEDKVDEQEWGQELKLVVAKALVNKVKWLEHFTIALDLTRT